MQISLKLVIGGFSVVIIALTVAISLLITNSFTMSAMRDIGRDHASGIVQAANAKVGSFFDQAVAHIQWTQEMVQSGNWSVPVDTVAAGDTQWWSVWEQHAIRLHRTFNWTYYTMVFVGFTDDFWMVVTLTNPTMYKFFRYLNTSMRVPYVSVHDVYTGRTLVPPTPAPPYEVRATYMPMWTNNPLTQLYEKRWAPPSFSWFWPGIATLVGGLHNASQTRFSKIALGFSLGQIQQFLQTVTLTTNSEAFLIDNFNMVLVTTHSLAPNNFLGDYNASVHYGPGCYLDVSLTPGMVCRMTAATFPYAPLQQLNEKRSDLLNTSNTRTTNGAQLLTLDSGKFYVSVAMMQCSMNAGLQWKLVLLMPEDDITGSVVKGRNIAIGTMCGVGVVLALVAFIFVAFVLRPLQRVGDRMYLAADLNDTEKDDDMSALTEIALLQGSYRNLRAKLNEMKAFVPQALLHGNELDEDDPVDDPVAKSPSEHSAKSRSGPIEDHSSSLPLETSGDLSQTSGHSGQVGRGLNVTASLVKKNISALVINIRKFQNSLDPLEAAAGLQLCDRLYHVIHAEVRDQKGVIGVFHGDHFLVTYNAASPAATAPKRAALTALKVCEAVKALSYCATCGISSGPAVCGKAGCSELKGFSCVGPVIVQAIAIERLAKLFSQRYGESVCVLSYGSCMADIECDVHFQIVDFVAMPNLEFLLHIVGKKGAKDEEWMYQLHEHESSDPYSAINAAFRALHRGNVDEARACYAKYTEKATQSSVDGVGAAQFAKFLEHSGEAKVDAMCSVAPLDTNHHALPYTDYGSFFACHF